MSALRNSLTAVLTAALAATAIAAGPSSQRALGDIDAEYELTSAEALVHEGPSDTGGINVWTHLSLWDGNTCHSESEAVNNPCDRILVHVLEAGEATMTLTPTYPGMDYDLVVFESGQSGKAFNVVAHEQNQTMIGPTGPYPLPGPETVTFEADADRYYLAVVFYRAAGGGYELTAELA